MHKLQAEIDFEPDGDAPAVFSAVGVLLQLRHARPHAPRLPLAQGDLRRVWRQGAPRQALLDQKRQAVA
eukprot:6322141-Prymnesium_polylepis.1